MNITSPLVKPQLYIVGTPIGNLEDMTPRAVNILKNCNLILAEDTRHSIYLLKKFMIDTPLKSYHQHNEKSRALQILDLLRAGQTIALISDAGMPVISDPGYIIVNLAHQNNIKVVVVPGPCAVSCAIALSGIDCSRFTFEGFLSSKQTARLAYLEKLKDKEKSEATIFYEAPHRILGCLNDIAMIFGSSQLVSVMKEMTKKHETVYHGDIQDVITQLESLDSIKGEFVIVIAGKEPESQDDTVLDKKIIKTLKLLLSENISVKQSVKIASKVCEANKNHVYDLALKLANER